MLEFYTILTEKIQTIFIKLGWDEELLVKILHWLLASKTCFQSKFNRSGSTLPDPTRLGPAPLTAGSGAAEE